MRIHFKYLLYLIRHKYYVFTAGFAVGCSLWQLIVHDWSKFLPSEWIPYARYFYGNYPSEMQATIQCPGYGGPTEESVAAGFDRAWLHHQHVSPHHWQHWVFFQDSGELKCLRIPLRYQREMVADWLGAGRTIKGKWEADKWYEANKENIKMDRGSRMKIEALLSAAARTMRGEA